MSSTYQQSAHLLSRTSSESSLSVTFWEDGLYDNRSSYSSSRWARLRRHAARTFSRLSNIRASYPGRPAVWRSLVFISKVIAFTIGFLILYSIIDAILFPSYNSPPKPFLELKETVRASSSPGRGNPRSEKVFIASNIINADLVRGDWGSSVLELIDYLGPDNVFISVYENDAGPDVADALEEFARKLKCMCYDHTCTPSV